MKILINILLIIGIVFSASAPGYNHDMFKVQPESYILNSEAFTSSFFSTQDLSRYHSAFYWNVPLWVAYNMKAYNGKIPVYQRPTTWATDPGLVAKGMATTEKPYRNSGYDKGHMCPKEGASRVSATADLDTHTMLNAVPQIHTFNAGIWEDLERKTFKWADTYGEIWVVCGPIFDNKTPTKFIGDTSTGKIAIAENNYKIVIKTNGGLSVLAFIYPNVEGKSPYDQSKFAVSVSEIEKKTGLTFINNGMKWNKDTIVKELWK